MSFFDDLSETVKNKSAEDLEHAVASGGLVSEGLHHAVLDGFREVTANSGLKGYELTFKIIGGPCKESTVKDTLWKSDKEQAQSRMLIFGHRLGLLKKVQVNGVNRYAPIEGKTDLIHCIGAEVVIDVKHEKYKDDKGNDKTAARLSFEGVLELGDKRCAKVARGSAPVGGDGGITPSGGVGGGSAGNSGGSQQNRQRSFADL